MNKLVDEKLINMSRDRYAKEAFDHCIKLGLTRFSVLLNNGKIYEIKIEVK